MSAPKIYQADPLTGEFMGFSVADPDPMDENNWLIPAMAFLEAPPVGATGFAIVHQPDSDVTWSVVPDLRGEVYSTQDGAPLQHNKLGVLPDGLTVEPMPSQHHVWVDGEWILDKSVQAIHEQIAERQWRDTEIDRIKWLRERHRDEQDLALTTTLTTQQFPQLLSYMQQLRDWPRSPDFPALGHRPLAPKWISAQDD